MTLEGLAVRGYKSSKNIKQQAGLKSPHLEENHAWRLIYLLCVIYNTLGHKKSVT